MAITSCFRAASKRVAEIVLVIIISVTAIVVNAQQTTSPPPDGRPPSVTDSGSPADTEQALIKIKSEFATVKLAAYIAMVLASLSGLVVFVYRRKRLMTFSKITGAITTAVLSLGLFALLSVSLSSSESSACASAALEVGTAAKDYDDVCRAARESAANSFGLASAFRSVFMSAGSDFIVPIGVGVLKLLSYISVLVASLLAFFISRPIAQQLFIRI